MIEARGVVKRFGGRPVLAGVDLRVDAGEAVALFGPNGAGKSTLLRAIAGVVRLDAGQILVDGVPAGEATALLRRRVGILGHQPFLYDHLSAEENLRFWGRVYGVADVSRRIESLLRRLGLWVFASDPVRTYSRGMIQRLAIARALLHEPELYLLDEPFSGLDRPGVRLLVEILQELRQTGRTLLVVSHRPDEVAAVCSRFVVLARGRVVAEVPKEAAGADTGPDWVRSLEALVDQALRTDQQAGRPGLPGAPGPGRA